MISRVRRLDDIVAVGELRTVEAVDSGLFGVGHHDGVDEHVDRTEVEECSRNGIHDADFGVGNALV